MSKSLKNKSLIINFDKVEVGNMKNAWVNSFQTLLETSEKITDPDSIKDAKYFKVKLMLRGMAIECLLKILKLSKGAKLVDTEGKLIRYSKGNYHDLNSITSELGINANETEIKMLNILSDSIETGRYPFLKSNKELDIRWITPTYENAFYSFIENTIELINSESANA